MKILAIIFLTIATNTIIFGQKSPITIYLAGDSTMAHKEDNKRPETGWGEMLQQHFNPKKVKIDNRAMNGRSTRTFISENRWQQVIDKLKSGDYVFIQFGHNDESKEKVDRYTSPEDFKKNLTKFVTEVRAKKAFPVLFTPVARRKFDDKGNLVDTHGDYPDYTRSVAKNLKVPLIDMQRGSEKILRDYGLEKSRNLFLQLKAGENPNYPKGIEDNTHFSPIGAEEMAKIAVAGIKESKIKLRKYIK